MYDFSVAKKKWRTIVSTYFRKTKRKSIRKIDFPKLLNDLYTSSFSPSSVSGGFRRAGVWPFDAGVMKEKVVRQAVPHNHPSTNTSSTSDILSDLLSDVNSPDHNTNHNNGSIASTGMDVDSPSSSSLRKRTFDDDDSDDSDNDSEIFIDTEPSMKKKSAYNGTADPNSNQQFNFSSNRNLNSLTGTKSSTSAQTSPRSP